MDERVKELLAHRTVAIRLPRGETEYWLTSQTFVIGESIRCRDRDWIVQSVSDGYARDECPSVTLGESESASPDLAA